MLPPADRNTSVASVAVQHIFPIMSKDDVISTKPELHNVFHYRQRRTRPLPSATCIENFVRFGRGCRDMQAGRHTDTLIAIPHTHPGGEVIVISHSYKDNVGTFPHNLCADMKQIIFSTILLLLEMAR